MRSIFISLALIFFSIITLASCTEEVEYEPVPRFNHVVLYVTDMDRSVAFYRDALGLEIHQEIGELIITSEGSVQSNIVSVNIVLMRLPGSKFIYELVESRMIPDSLSTGSHFQHIGIEVTDIEHSLDVAVRNGALEAIPISTIEAGDIVTKTVYFKGPDGEQIELMQILSGDY